MTLLPPPAEWISKKPGQNFVLLHGMAMAPAFWTVFAPEVTRRGRTVAYPLPGHHPWSLPEPGTPITADEVVEAMARAIGRDFASEPVTLIGHSTGGFLSLLLAARRPDLVRSVILLGGFACGRFEGKERFAARMLRVPRVGPYVFRHFFKRWISTREQFRWGSIECVYDKSCPWEDDRAADAMEMVRSHLLRTRPEDVAACVHFMSNTSILGDLPNMTLPVLNLVGVHDGIVPPAHQLRLSKLLPRAQTVLFGDCGHLVMVEQKRQMDKVIAGFVDPHSSVATALRGRWAERFAPLFDDASTGASSIRLPGLEQFLSDNVEATRLPSFAFPVGEGIHVEHNSNRHRHPAVDRRTPQLGL